MLNGYVPGRDQLHIAGRQRHALDIAHTPCHGCNLHQAISSLANNLEPIIGDIVAFYFQENLAIYRLLKNMQKLKTDPQVPQLLVRRASGCTPNGRNIMICMGTERADSRS